MILRCLARIIHERFYSNRHDAAEPALFKFWFYVFWFYHQLVIPCFIAPSRPSFTLDIVQDIGQCNTLISLNRQTERSGVASLCRRIPRIRRLVLFNHNDPNFASDLK